MNNDILEQLTEDYLRELGYFTQHNISYRPKSHKQTPSDIDILAIHPLKTINDLGRVIVVSCKSWQSGLIVWKHSRDLLENPDKIINGKTPIKLWREATTKEWSEALTEKVFELTGQKVFMIIVEVGQHYLRTVV